MCQHCSYYCHMHVNTWIARSGTDPNMIVTHCAIGCSWRQLSAGLLCSFNNNITHGSYTVTMDPGQDQVHVPGSIDNSAPCHKHYAPGMCHRIW